MSGLSLARNGNRRRQSAPGFEPRVIARAAQLFEAAAAGVSVTLSGLTLAVGDRLIVCLTRSSASTDLIAPPADWIPITGTNIPGILTAGFCAPYYLDVTAGHVADVAAAFTGGTSTLSASHVWQIRGHDPSKAPEAVAVVQGTSNATTNNPTTITPSWGLGSNLWLHYLGIDRQATASGADPCVTVWPTGLDSPVDTRGTSTTHDATTTNGVGQGFGDRQLRAASLDPTAWTYNSAGIGGRSLSLTIAVAGS